MARTLSAIRQVIQQILRDEFNPDVSSDWKEDELDIHIGNILYEVSEASPLETFEPVIVTANSKKLDISSIEDLINIYRAEYTINADPRNYRNIVYLDNQTIEMKIDSKPSSSGSSGTLTGTVTFTSGSATVTGSGTDFDGELAQNYYIKPSTKSHWYRVYSVESDTSLTLDEPVKAEDNGADTEDLTQYREGVALVYFGRLHTLNDDKSTLNPKEEQAIILGVCGNAAISKARELMNKVNRGGGATASNMNNWGILKLELYRQALRRLSPPVPKTVYSRS
jgi:hypothetical protein